MNFKRDMLNFVEITQVRSSIGRCKKHKSTLISLGLRRIGHTVKCIDTPSIRGMINLISYMVKVKE